MHEDIYVYRTELTGGFDEAVLKCFGGYTVYIDSRLDDEHARKAYLHALHHIEHDFDKFNVSEIEKEAHE